jgi:hypothetical protein
MAANKQRKTTLITKIVVRQASTQTYLLLVVIFPRLAVVISLHLSQTVEELFAFLML